MHCIPLVSYRRSLIFLHLSSFWAVLLSFTSDQLQQSSRQSRAVSCLGLCSPDTVVRPHPSSEGGEPMPIGGTDQAIQSRKVQAYRKHGASERMLGVYHVNLLGREAAFASTTELKARNGGVPDAGRKWLCCQKPLARLMPQKAMEPREFRPKKMLRDSHCMSWDPLSKPIVQ